MKLFTFASKCKGSISLFLTIILLPTLTFTGLMVDSANLALSKSVAENAGDLATNAALANYDTILNDVYGLLAMSQTVSSSADAERYFKNTMEATTMLNNIQGALSGLNQNIKDWLGVDKPLGDINTNFLNVSYDSFSLKGVSGSSLRNHQVLKNQIVEFMKYRGPAEIAMDLFGGLSSFESADSKVNVTAAKTDADAAKADLGSACGTLYKALVEYDKRVLVYKDAEKEWRDSVEDLNKKLQRVNQLEHLFLCNAPDLDHVYYVEKYNKKGKSLKFTMNTKHKTIGDYSDWNELVALYYEHRQINEVNDMGLCNYFYTTRYMYPDYLPQCRDAYNQYLEAYPKLANLMYIYQKIAKLVDDKNCTFGLNPDDYGGKGTDEFKEAVKAERAKQKEWVDKYANEHAAQVWEFSEFAKYGVTQYKEILKKVKGEAETLYNEVYTKFNNYYSAVESLTGCDLEDGKALAKQFLVSKGAYKQTKDHKNNYNYMLYLCNEIKVLLKAFIQENNELKKETEKYGKDVAKDQLYNEMLSEVSLNETTFNSEDLEDLILQIQANKNYVLNGVAGRYNSYTLYNKLFRKMSKLSDFGKQMYVVNNELEKETGKGFDYKKYDEYFEQYFPNKFYSQAYSFTEKSYLKMFSEGGIKAGNTTVNISPFYLYLLTAYGGYTKESDDADNAANNISSMNEGAKEEVDEETGYTKYDLSVFSSLATEGEALDTSKNIGSLSGGSSILRQFSSISRTVKGMFGIFKNGLSGLTDNLLVTEYVFQNFSHAVTPAVAKNTKKTPMTTTNVAINKNNNKIYACEIEYILEGYRGREKKTKKFLWWEWTVANGCGPEKNVTIVKTNIYMIRFLMNAIFAMTNGTIRAQVQAPAAALSAACLGIIPQPVWAVILQLGLAIAESTYDLNQLMKGNEMPVYKSIKNWKFQMGTLANVLVEEAGNYVKDKVKDTADKLINNVETTLGSIVSQTGDKISGSVDDVLHDITGELSDIVKEQVGDLTASLSDVIKKYVEETYMNLITGALKFDAEQFGEGLKGVIDKFCTGSNNKLVSLIADKGPDLIDSLVNNSSVTKELDKISKKLQYSVDLGDNLDTNFVMDTEMLGEILDGTTESLDDFFDSIADELADKAGDYVDGYIDIAEDEIQDVITKYGDEANLWTDQMSEKIGKSVNNWLNDTLGTFTTGDSVSGTLGGNDSSFLGKLVNFSYEDYLRILVLFGLSSSKDQAGIINRIGDVIELNIDGALKDYYKKVGLSKHAAGTSFSLSKAYTYVELSANINIKPLLLSQSIFSNGKGIGLWSYKYTNTQGY